ncbi:tRNA 2-selenouridine synthase [Campylobacter concisus]|uniref:tRNA 2-selenouridine synthase n=1 Tax=Campylobacter concisus TaxID=199 RepID=A0A7S9RPZ3_9BACT|nr:tRNA 2-selenouridine synthase [Campylobacter concisus]QPH95836.1 tRNA 2-selenouridine synthase [Campylobacter concisus]
MKFIGIILLLLTSIFLIACSANQASNKISNSELENLASKYGGVYIFNQKFVEEIEKREAERKAVNQQILSEISHISNKSERNKKMRELLKERYYNNKKIEQILSNGKRYYTIWTTYENETGKKVKISKEFTDKIKNFIGLENYKNAGASIDMSYFYIDKDNIAIPIRLTLNFYNISKSYGLYGDEGRGISFSKERLINIAGDNVFYFDSSKNTFVKEK